MEKNIENEKKEVEEYRMSNGKLYKRNEKTACIATSVKILIE